jgi:hypothetical protein
MWVEARAATWLGVEGLSLLKNISLGKRFTINKHGFCCAAFGRDWHFSALPTALSSVGYRGVVSTGRRNTRVTLTKRSPNRLQDNRLPAMAKLRFLGRS